MKLNRLGKAFASTVLAASCVLPFVAQADSPDNLDIVWARTAGEKAPIYSQKSTSSRVVQQYPSKYTVYLTGEETDAKGNVWYEVSWPMKGWLKKSDSWFAPQVKGYYPDNLALPERLADRLAIDFGNYPQSSIKKFGKPMAQKYWTAGGVIYQQLNWSGLEIQYENSYRRAEGAWISALTVSKGSKYNFGPIHVGDPVEKLGEFGIERPAADGEVTIGNYQEFRFIIKGGKVDSMSYRYGIEFLPPKK